MSRSSAELKQGEKRSNNKISGIYTCLVLLLIISDIALAYENWVGHALIGIISLMLMIYTLTTGAMLRGRIKRSKRISGNTFMFHRKSGIYFGAFILGLFIYGLSMRLYHGEAILSSVHGKLGLIVLFIVALQLIPSLILKNRDKYRELHKIVGYTLATVLVIDTSWGLHNGAIGGTKSIVLLHSMSGGLVALALIWIIIEIRYPSAKSIARVKIASYLAAFLLTAGCWIVGGYNYLTSYGSQVKPVITAGPYPWAHEIVMEAKEHIFVFLPIIAFALSITLSTLDRESFLSDVKCRRGLSMIAFLALFMVLLMFLMGQLYQVLDIWGRGLKMNKSAITGCIIIAHDLSPDFKQSLATLTGHHWTSVSIITIVLFALFSGLLLGLKNARKILRVEGIRLWSTSLMVVTLIMILGIIGQLVARYLAN